MLDPDRAELCVRRIEDALPAGTFDLVVSTLAVHHLEGEAKGELFGRVHAVLRPGGRFVLADVVVPERPEDAIKPISPDYDYPSSVADQLRWLENAGFSASLCWQRRDLALMVADRLPRRDSHARPPRPLRRAPTRPDDWRGGEPRRLRPSRGAYKPLEEGGDCRANRRAAHSARTGGS